MATKKKTPKKSKPKAPPTKAAEDLAREFVISLGGMSPPPPIEKANPFVGVPVSVVFKDRDVEALAGQFPTDMAFGGMFLPFETGGGKVLLNASSIDQIWLAAPDAAPVEPPEPQDPVGVDV